jgi:hypothetical protein
MNTNDLVYKVAAKAKALADESLVLLRIQVASKDATTHYAMMKESMHRTRGDMIEEILCEEFIEEFPKEICDE